VAKGGGENSGSVYSARGAELSRRSLLLKKGKSRIQNDLVIPRGEMIMGPAKGKLTKGKKKRKPSNRRPGMTRRRSGSLFLKKREKGRCEYVKVEES